LVRLRFEHPALSIGTMTPIKASVPEVFAYLREEEGEVFLFVANLSSKPVRDYHVTLHAGLPPRATDAINGRRLSNTAPGAYKPAGELPAHGWLLMQLTDVRE
jgi:hypothetical protein